MSGFNTTSTTISSFGAARPFAGEGGLISTGSKQTI
jgi:hypothetical protein